MNDMKERGCYIIIPDPGLSPFTIDLPPKLINAFFLGTELPYWPTKEEALKYLRDNNLQDNFVVMFSSLEQIQKRLDKTNGFLKLKSMV
jgi:hypothetical protein